MLDILRDFLIDNSTPEMLSAIDDAHQAFDRIGLEDYETGYENVLMEDSNADQGETVGKIVQLTLINQMCILSEFAITPVTDQPISRLTDIINGILDIEAYEDKETIERILSTHTSPEEKFCEALSLITIHSVEEMLPFIERVGEPLLAKLHDLVATKLKPMLSEAETVERDRFITRFECFQIYSQVQASHTEQLLAANISVGLPFMVYANTIGRDLESMPPITAAHELIAMAIISVDGTYNPRKIINENIEHFISDLDLITKIDIIVSDFMLGFEQGKSC